MASTGEAWRLGRRPALDGVRGLAVALVMLAHLYLPGLSGGGIVGVTMFFTLSGFLITSLLLEERAGRGRISLAGFYRRRVARLLPALALVAVVVVAAGLAGVGAVVAVAVYVGNWVRVAGGDLGYLSHTWSLAIEEQFYLAWPLVLMVVRSRRALLALAGGGAVAAVCARLLLWDGGAGLERVYYGTDTRADAVLLGCLVAVWLHGRPAPTLPTGLATISLAAAAAGSLIGAGFGAYVVLPLVVAALAAVGILAGVTTAPPAWLCHPALTYCGRRSYGLYLWHVPLIWLTQEYGAGLPSRVLALAAAVMLAEVSWHYVEKPIQQRLRGRSDDPVEAGDGADLEVSRVR